MKFSGSYALLVRLDRDCVAATCPSPGGSPAFTECLAGRCVDPECDVSDPATYADHCCDPLAPSADCPNILYCNDVSECAAVGTCAEAQCIEGACVESPIPDACAPVEWCDPSPVSGGCRPLMSTADAGSIDAGVDGGDSDAGVDGGDFDAGVDGGDSDAGVDGGDSDAGVDGGDSDAGVDGGEIDAGASDMGTMSMDTDLGVDAGRPDLGVDAGDADLGFDAGEPDLGFDAGFDAGAPDLGVDGGTPDAGLDPRGRRILLVTNTEATGPGSLAEALAIVNDRCAAGPYAVHFAIPLEDRGFFFGRGGGGWWRISGLAAAPVLCPGTLIDGTTQGLAFGDKNPFVLRGLVVGESGLPLPELQGPEIELRGTQFQFGADDVTVRGLAMKSVAGRGARLVFEQCFVASEPDGLVSLPIDERSVFAGFYTDNCPDCVVRESVFMGGDAPDGTRSLISVRDGSPRMTIRDSYFGGMVASASVNDLLYLVPADDHRVIHNYLGAIGYEFYVEWVPGSAGEISENTFDGVASEAAAISMGGASLMYANVYRTIFMPL